MVLWDAPEDNLLDVNWPECTRARAMEVQRGGAGAAQPGRGKVEPTEDGHRAGPRLSARQPWLQARPWKP